jgi:glutamyl-tRNA synthetase
MENEKEFHQVTEKRIFPEAVINFLALLGWNDGTDKEIYTRRVSRSFDLNRVHKAALNLIQKK